MKQLLIIVLLAFLCPFANAQLLSTNPAFPTDNAAVTISMDPALGNRGLFGFNGPVYVHTGVITNLSTSPSNWRYVQTQWATTTAPQATLQNGRWEWTISNIRSFYNVPPGEQILYIAILFRNATGTLVQRNADGSDMYIPVYQSGAFAAKFTSPFMQPTYVPIPEPISPSTTSVPVTAVSSLNANLTLRLNGTVIGSATNATTVSATANLGTCEQVLTLEATNGSTTLRDTISLFRPPTTYPTGARPTGAGIRDGITFQNNGTQATFILYAPFKQSVMLVGDFNNWQQTCAGQMRRETDANGNFYYWTQITGLTPGQQYRFQYIVDDSIRIADPYSELVLDPNNDRFISASIYPDMPQYPTGRTPGGFVGVFTAGGDSFTWTDNNYVRPNKYNLNIYQLLMRDFTQAQSYQVLKDTLDYLQRLGINCIKLLPVNEFDGNNSWGYNPAYFFALDKAYGSKRAFKEFINEAHRRGIAVVIDAVLNHATGNSPLAAMWWDRAQSRPAANNPYFYEVAQHPFNVYNDFNHNVAPTRYHVERFIEYWLTEYKLDGFRWDLSKGFTVTNCGSDMTCWNAYSQGRIDIWQNYYNRMQAVSPGSYCILEHLAGDAEEYELAARGMLLWGKMTDQFNQNTMGFSTNSDVNRAYWMNRSVFNSGGNASFISDKPGIIAYAESHDEQRIMYQNLNFGNTSNPSHNVRDLATALRRTQAMAALLLSIPGPKMIWQFGEVGYDFHINRCEDGSISEGCRTAPKPVRWDYWTNPTTIERRRLYETFAVMHQLRLARPDAFNRATITTGTNLGNDLWKTVVVNHSTLKLVFVGNFDVNQQTRAVTFPTAGTYYNYLQGGTFTSFGSPQNITLGPGEFRVFIDQNIPGFVTSVRDQIASNADFGLSVYPNPVQQTATVKYDLPESGQVSIQLLNMQGQVVASRNMGFQLKGVQFFELNRHNIGTAPLKAGQYVLQVRVNNLVRYEKIMVQQ
jgi:1,4-alpha-glucan branching enzyme